MMMQDGASGGDARESAVSVGQEDQAREQKMEQEQRRQDEGLGMPPEANPHSQINRMDRGRQTVTKGVSTPQVNGGDDHQPWQGRKDDPDRKGQTPEGALGGGGPAQP